MTPINKIVEQDIEDFKTFPHLNAYQRIALKSAIYPGQGTHAGLIYVALKGAGEAGEFAEHVGKAMRDDNLIGQPTLLWPDDGGDAQLGILLGNELLEERRIALLKEIGDQLWYLAAKARELGADLADVAELNLRKLADRTSRDMLQGSGDER